MKTAALMKRAGILAGLIGGFAVTGSAFAQDQPSPRATISGVLDGTYQTATESHVDGEPVEGEFNGELYLLGTLQMGPGGWTIEVRGSTTPRDHGVTSYYGSNALVGETTNSAGDGRIAATQLFYDLPVGSGQFQIGLLDPTALLDGNNIDDNEYTQFLADVFVNNPSIGFPSYVLGGSYAGQFTKQFGYKLFLSSDSGLQADDDPTYRNVFDLTGKRDGYDKGVFNADELDWQNGAYSAQLGVWYDSGQVAPLAGTDNDFSHVHGQTGYGVYALGGIPVGSQGSLEVRAGVANEHALSAANFLALAYQQSIKFANRGTVLGVAVARTGDSSQLSFRSDPIYQAEAYWRVNVVGALYVSPDIQVIDHPAFQANQHAVVIGGARVGLVF